MKKTISGLISLFIVLVLSVPVAFSANGKYEIAVLPQQPPDIMYSRWFPFVQRLEKDLGIEIDLKLFQTMDQFEIYAMNAEPDFIFSTPTQLVYFNLNARLKKYIPLVRANRELSGVLFVNNDSPITKIEDLDGKNIAFVGTQNVCSVLTRNILRNQDVRWKNIYAGSSQNVVKFVKLKKSDAGALLDLSFIGEKPEMAGLRIIYQTKSTPFHPLSANKKTPRALRDAMTREILALWKDKNASSLLKGTALMDPIKADYDRDYRELEMIDYDFIYR